MSPQLVMAVALNLAGLRPACADVREPVNQPPNAKASAALAAPMEPDRATGRGEARRERGAPPPAALRPGADPPREAFTRPPEPGPEAGAEAGPAATLRLYQQAHRGF